MKISFVNEFLAQASLPVIDHKNVIETTSVVCDRIAKVYAGREVNSRVTLKAAQAQVCVRRFSEMLASNQLINLIFFYVDTL